MPRKNSSWRYSDVCIPIKIMDTIDKYIKEHPEVCYRSRAEFITEAIREKLKS